MNHQDDLIKSMEIFNSLFDCIIICDLHGNIMGTNDSACHLLGYSENSLQESNLFDHIKEISEEEEEEEIFEQISLKKMILKGIVHSRKLHLLTASKQEISVLFSVNQKGSHLLAIAKDITQLESAQKNLERERSGQVYHARMKALGEMAAGIAHEINNPLSIVSGHCHYLKKEIQKVPFDKSEVLETIHTIDETVNRMATIIKGLRTISRDSETDKMKSFSFSDLLKSTLSLCHDRLKKQKIKFQLTEEKKSIYIDGIPTQISQVIINLINNSCDAIEGKQDKWIHLETYEKDKFLWISVTDSGNGIPEHIVDKMLDPFFTTKEVGKGTGLGMSLAVNFIEKHKGKLWYDKEHPNTRFFMTLPIVKN